MKVRLFTYICFATFVCLLFIQCKTKPQFFKSKKSIEVQNAAVVTAHPEASQVGLDILLHGGNAVDAAIAVQFALAVCYPIAGNIGGGGFMVFRNDQGKVSTLDFREKAPMAATDDMYQDEAGNLIEGLSTLGALSVGVPGTVDGMVQSFEKFSLLKDWAMLLQPAIDLARNGFRLTTEQAANLNSAKENFQKANPKENIFSIEETYQTGDLFIQESLARTLELIRDQKRDGFYKGEVAQAMVNTSSQQGGVLSLEDLESYQAKWRDPIHFTYKNYDIYSMGPPSSGGVLLAQLLHAVEQYPLCEWGFQNPVAVHLIVESEKRAYADRAHHLGDPDYYDVPLKELISKQYMVDRMADFNPLAASPIDSITHGAIGSEETTHFSIVDIFGNAVSVTTTLNGAFGSFVYVEGAGFLLNNEMDDFSAKPGTPNLYGLVGAEANKIEPGKRMLSSMTPTIVEKDDELFMVLGSPGGSTIITSVFQTILNVVEYNMPAYEAVRSPRFHHQWSPPEVFMERGMWDSTKMQTLRDLGHVLKVRSPIGRVELIIKQDSVINAAADIRGDDDAKGY